MESTGYYQNMHDPYRQQQDHDQTELYEYDNERNSASSRLGNLFGTTLLQKPPKILRNAPNLIDALPANVNRTLLYAKLFYFWYFAAFGSLFPLLSIYFKQMGMGPSYCGILMGFRPFVEFFSAPFWSVVSTRFRQAKNILLMALLSWIIFTVAIGLIKPPPHSCWREMNATHQGIERVGYATSTGKSHTKLQVKRQAITLPNISLKNIDKTKELVEQGKKLILNQTNSLVKNVLNETMNKITNATSSSSSSSRRRKTTTTTTTASSTTTVISTTTVTKKSKTKLPIINDDDDDDKEDDDVESGEEDNPINENRKPKPTTTTLKPKSKSNKKPANTNNLLHVHTPQKTIGNPMEITLTNLSLVKPLASPVLYEQKDVRNVFMVFLLLIIIGEFFSAPAITLADACTLTYLGQDTELYGRQRMFGSLGWGLAIFIVATILDQSKSLTFYACGTSGPLEKNYTICFAAFSVCMTFALISATRFKFSYESSEEVPLNTLNKDLKRSIYPTARLNTNEHDIHSVINDEQQVQVNIKQSYQNSNTMKLMQLIQVFATLKNGTFLFIAWWMGCGVGLVFTFLFWHLQDLGGSPTLFGVASVINHTSELFAYFFLHELIHRFGHIKILYLGLLGNFIRFVYISIITNPWWVLPFEFIQGLTHAAVWATACSYLSQAAPESLRLSCQGVLQGFHFGFGRGCGALFGGFFASYFGTDITFRAYGFICLIFMGLFIYLNQRFHQQIASNYGQNLNIDDPHQFIGNSPLLAPHGAPTNPKWQTKFSSGLTAGIKQDQLHSTSIPPLDNQTTTGNNPKDYHYGY